MRYKNLFWCVVLVTLAVVHNASAQSWTTQFNLSSGEGINGIKTVDENTVWAASNSQCFRTTNGGTTWEQVPAANIPPPGSGELGTFASNTAIAVESVSNAWFGTLNADPVRVFRTKDKGRTWTVANTPLSARGLRAGLSTIAFSDSLNGFAGGSGFTNTNNNLMRTTDGGKSWCVVTSYPGNSSNTLSIFPGRVIKIWW